MHIDKTHLLLGVKVALGAALAIFLANLLHLQYSATAGVITLLSIMGTKRETFRVARGRLLAYLISLGVAHLCYALLGYRLLAYAAFLFVITVVCATCEWPFALSIMAVLASHFLTAKNMSAAMVLNETAIFLIGTGCGILVNLHLRADEDRMYARLDEVDEKMKAAMLAVVHDVDAPPALAALQHATEEAERTCVINADNRLTSSPLHPIHYVQLRSNQGKILHQIDVAMSKMTMRPAQYDMVSSLMEHMAEDYRRKNDVSTQFAAFEAVLADMRTQPLPVTRPEFECRAVLYYVLLRLEDFLQLERQFYQENGSWEA